MAEPRPAAAEELRRYGRQLVLPEVGPAGQARLRAARVLVIGAGGLGSPAALYLAAAGVGTLGIVEFDRVDETNLHRQILFASSDVGRPKVEAAVERLAALNPQIQLVPHAVRFDLENALEMVSAYDLVVDGSDNFPTRYLVNDACVRAGRPVVHGAIFRFEGQLSIFAAPGGPCYRCLFPEPPPPGTVPSCAEAGVLGALPGIVGSLQAAQALQWLLGIGTPLVGRLLSFDSLGGTFHELRFERDAGCPVCAPGAADRPLRREEAVCELPTEAFDLEPEELARRLADGERVVLLDVREAVEREVVTLPDALWIPLRELPKRLDEVPADAPVVVYCHLGGRSARATRLLRDTGHIRTWNLAGGIDAWSCRIDSSLSRY